MALKKHDMSKEDMQSDADTDFRRAMERLRDLEDRMDNLEQGTSDGEGSSISVTDGKLIEGYSFAAGNNSLLHGLQRVPKLWIPSRVRGAFQTSTVSLYPDIGLHKRWWGDYQHSTNTTATHTMGFTPTDGNRLIALVMHGQSTYSVSSISQTGVTWTRLSNASVGSACGMMAELWMGTSVSSASTSLSVVYDTSSSGDSMILIVEIPEVDADTCRNITDGEFNVGSPDTGVMDSQDMFTEPTPNAGDISIMCLFANLATTRSLPTGTGWRVLGVGTMASVGSNLGGGIMMKVAQAAEAVPFIGHQGDNGWYGYIRADFASSIAQPSVTVPHGLREISRSASTLILNTENPLTADIWIA